MRMLCSWHFQSAVAAPIISLSNSDVHLFCFRFIVFLVLCSPLALADSPIAAAVNQPHNGPISYEEYSTEEQIGKDQLLLVQVVWRHGDRAPIQNYPTDPNGEDKWLFGWGELTPLGIRQQMSLGHLLRKKYILELPLISRIYSPKEMYVRSTDVNRTLASATANLVGMFPPTEDEEDRPHWVPIPVHTLHEETDYIGNIAARCPRADQIQSVIRSSPAFLNVSKANAVFFQMISEHSGQIFNLTNIGELSDTVYIESLYNLTQPAWLNNDVVTRIHNLTLKSNEFYFGIEQSTYSPELIRLRGGNLLRDIVDRMVTKLVCKQQSEGAQDDKCKWISQLKYYAYSAHDTTLAALLCTFGNEERVVPGGLPHYTASIAIELWNTEALGPAVRVLYHSAFHQDYRTITDLTSGCPKGKALCPLEVFSRRSVKFMPVNIRKECRPKPMRAMHNGRANGETGN